MIRILFPLCQSFPSGQAHRSKVVFTTLFYGRHQGDFGLAIASRRLKGLVTGTEGHFIQMVDSIHKANDISLAPSATKSVTKNKVGLVYALALETSPMPCPSSS